MHKDAFWEDRNAFHHIIAEMKKSMLFLKYRMQRKFIGGEGQILWK